MDAGISGAPNMIAPAAAAIAAVMVKAKYRCRLKTVILLMATIPAFFCATSRRSLAATLDEARDAPRRRADRVRFSSPQRSPRNPARSATLPSLSLGLRRADTIRPFADERKSFAVGD